MSRHWRHSRCHKNRIKITHRLYCGIDHDFDPTLTSLAQNKYQARGRQLSLTVTLLQIKPDNVPLMSSVNNAQADDLDVITNGSAMSSQDERLKNETENAKNKLLGEIK